MSVKFQAPHPGNVTTTLLPNPTFGDSDSLELDLDVSYAMTGKRRTYVKTNDDHKYNYTFQLTRMKSLELKAFLIKYFTATIKMTNHKNEVIIGKFLSNPFEFDSLSRAEPGRELVGITLQFQGKPQ